MGVCRQVTENEGTTLLYLSHRGPDAPNPPEYDPAKVFERLFGRGRGGPGDLGKSVLDVVSEDTRRLGAALGQAIDAGSDQHLDSIRELERRLVRDLSSGPVPRTRSRPLMPGVRAGQPATGAAARNRAGPAMKP